MSTKQNLFHHCVGNGRKQTWYQLRFVRISRKLCLMGENMLKRLVIGEWFHDYRFELWGWRPKLIGRSWKQCQWKVYPSSLGRQQDHSSLWLQVESGLAVRLVLQPFRAKAWVRPPVPCTKYTCTFFYITLWILLCGSFFNFWNKCEYNWKFCDTLICYRLKTTAWNL